MQIAVIQFSSDLIRVRYDKSYREEAVYLLYVTTCQNDLDKDEDFEEVMNIMYADGDDKNSMSDVSDTEDYVEEVDEVDDILTQ